MKKLIPLLSTIIIIIISVSNHSIAQNVTVTGATFGDSSYATLSAAFTAINGGVQTGANITISISGNTVEPATGADLNNGTWSSILIKPSGGASRIISGAITAGNPLIDFNGADKVVIDGLNSEGNSLTFTNTTISSSSGTSTIRFQTDATNNIITRCSILGSSTSSVATLGWNIFFGSNSSISGNDNNTISNCDIGPAGTNLPSKAVYFSGTNNTTLSNNGDTIRDCNIFDYFSATTTSAGILVSSGSTDVTIKNNKFFQTGARTQTTSSLHSCINISNTSGNNYQILGNIIGFANSTGTGIYSINGVSNTFRAIYVNVGTTLASSIQGNIINGISQSTGASGISILSSCIMIFIDNGLTNVGDVTGNTIGSLSTNGSISFNSTSASASDVLGIVNFGVSAWNCSNNNIGGITVSNSSTGAANIYCIRVNTTSSVNFMCENNTIGGIVANSIQSTTTSNASIVNGILNEHPIGTIKSNIVRNLTAAGGTGINASASVVGISINAGTSSNHTVSQNTIYSLTNTNSSASAIVTGIYYNSLSGNNLISRNFVHSLQINNQTAIINGISSNNGKANYQNNMIRLGLDGLGNSINYGAGINGITDASSELVSSNNFYFNSIYIGGSPTSGSSNTFAFTSNEVSVIRNYRNNIFFNARSNNGSTGKHYAVRVGGTNSIQSDLKIDNNVYLSNGNGGIFGLFNSIDIISLGAWQTAVGQDLNSYNSDPQFVLPTGSVTTINLHINPSVQTIVESHGFDIISITDDFDGESRIGLTPIDIGADAGNFTGLFQNDVVNVSEAISANGSYSTLAGAFNVISSVVQTGANIKISITGNTSEPPTGVVINNGTWSSILIQPSGGVARTISGSVNAGIPLIRMNGADKVKIDGLNSEGNSLTFTNTTVSSASGTSTILFQNDATNNIITNCTVLGSSTVNTGINVGGVIAFGTSPSLVSGNDNNTISYCNIGAAGTNTPTKAISFVGTTTTSQLYNSGDTIRNCNIFDYFNETFQSAGINIYLGNTDISIRSNKFYQTSSRSQTLGRDHAAIWIESSYNNSSNNFDISENIIGYSSPLGTGTYIFNGVPSSNFVGIYISVDTMAVTSLQGNKIAGISMSGNISSFVGFQGIYIANGLTNIGNITGNIIGSQSDQTSININSTSALSTASKVYGIYNSGSSNWTCSNNKIGGITTSNLNSGLFSIYGIVSSIPIAKLFVCQNNIIGGNSEQSILNILNISTPAASEVDGILLNGSRGIVTGNIIRNIGSTGSTLLNGIVIDAASSASQIISQNIIYSLTNYDENVFPTITGIDFTGSPGTNLISRNLIHTFFTSSSSAILHGLYVRIGSGNYQNNIIRLGISASGSSVNKGCNINGIFESQGTNNFYFNSIYIGGSPTGGISNTYAFRSSVIGVIRNYRNNIYYNSRSNNGSIGYNYAIRVEGLNPNPTGLTLNNNVYFVTGVGGTLGYYNGSNRINLSAWQSAVGQDANSYSSDPRFLTPNGSVSTIDLHINPLLPSVIDGNGFNIASVTDDFDGQLRSGFTPTDIGADAGDYQPVLQNNVSLTEAILSNRVFLLGKSYNINATVKNLGIVTQSIVPVYFSVNGSFPIGPVNTSAPIAQYGTGDITFNGVNAYTPTLVGTNTLKIYTALSSDEYRINDTVTISVNVQQKVSSFPYVETFTNLINWNVLYENPLYDTPLWETGYCTNPTGRTYDTAATSNCYLGAPGRKEILMSPVLDFSSITLPVLDFYTSYTGYLGLDDSLEVLLSTDNGLTFFSATTVYNNSRTSTPSLATRPVRFTEFFPDSSKQWRHEQVSLSNVAGNANVIIGFRSKSDYGNRQWIDNVIVSEANTFASQTVLSPGMYNFGNVSIVMNTVGLIPTPQEGIQDHNHSGIFKSPPQKNKIINSFPGAEGIVKVNSNNELDNPSGGKLTVVTYPYRNPVPSDASPQIAINDTVTGTTTGDGSRFTPNNIIPDVYLTASYTGNDYLGYAMYDMKINVSGISSIPDINKVYILKRSDRIDSWKCLNTTVSGTTLIASGLDIFSDFSIGILSPVSPVIILDLTMFIEGFYNSTSNYQVSDTIKVYLRNSTPPYGLVDSAKAIVAVNGTTTLTFLNAPNGIYYVVLNHRNTIETWSAAGIAMTQGGSVSYDFSNAIMQAFGSNEIQIDNSPNRFAIFSGDVNKDGFIDLSDVTSVYNDANAFVTGYKNSDVTGDNITDLTDLLFTYNNNTIFVAIKKPAGAEMN